MIFTREVGYEKFSLFVDCGSRAVKMLYWTSDCQALEVIRFMKQSVEAETLATDWILIEMFVEVKVALRQFRKGWHTWKRVSYLRHLI